MLGRIIRSVFQFVLALLPLLIVASVGLANPPAPTHDLAIDSIYYPRIGERINGYFSPEVGLENKGSSNESNVLITATITDPFGKEVYRDSLFLHTIAAGSKRDTVFHEYLSQDTGRFYITITVQLPLDDVRTNDTLRSYFQGTPPNDLQAVRVAEPANGAVELGKVPFGISAQFLVTELSVYYTRFRAILRACNNSRIIYQADTTVDTIRYDAAPTVVRFAPYQGRFDTRNLKPGCYSLIIFSQNYYDLNPSNDTAFSTFTIVPDTLPNEVATDSILAPLNGNPWGINDSVPVIFRFKNTGSNDQSSASVTAVAANAKGVVLYRDTVQLLNWKRNESRVVSFRPFVPDSAGTHTVYGISILPNDAYTLNDTLSRLIDVGYFNDVRAVAVIHPVPADTIYVGHTFTLQAAFKWVATDGIDSRGPFRFMIRRCNDSSLVYQADTVIDSLPRDRTVTLITFPDHQGQYSLIGLDPGCYHAYAIARQIGDQHHANDTATSTFEILPTQAVTSSRPIAPVLLYVQNASPNPFAARSSINYHLREAANVTIRISDVAGRIVQQSGGSQSLGDHTYRVDLSAFSGGCYYMALEVVTPRGEAVRASTMLVHESLR